jgi:Fe-S cluster assembly protein SufD
MALAVQETIYTKAFQQALEQTNTNWLRELRTDSFAAFTALGWPAPRHEEWKYTNLAPLVKAFSAGGFSCRADVAGKSALAAHVYEETAQSRIVFVNGQFRADLSDLSALPAGVVVTDLGAAAQETHAQAALARERLARGADYQEAAFTALNTALWASGALVYAPQGVEVAAPLQVLFLADPQDERAFSNTRLLVVAAARSKLTLVESYSATHDCNYWTNGVTEIFVGDGANVEHYKIQRESADAFHIHTTHTELGRDSRYDATNINLGGAISRHDIGIKFTAPGAEAWADGLYLMGDAQHTDTHSRIDHSVAHCASRQSYKGILDGKARAVFNGKVFVHEQANGTDAQQSNKNLLLSNTARVDTKPQLEIYNDDVKCAHGATVGQMEEEELFYLLSRGLHEGLARNLLTYGFAEEIINKIAIPSVKAQLDETVLNRLHAKLEA